MQPLQAALGKNPPPHNFPSPRVGRCVCVESVECGDRFGVQKAIDMFTVKNWKVYCGMRKFTVTIRVIGKRRKKTMCAGVAEEAARARVRLLQEWTSGEYR